MIEERQKQNVSVFLLICLISMIFIQIALLATLVISWNTSDSSEMFVLYFLNGLFFVIIVINASVFIALRRNQRKEQARIETEYTSASQTSIYGNSQTSLDRYGTLNEAKPNTANETKMNIVFVPYTGEVQGKKCMICKLEIREGQKIMICEGCLSLFHKEHILEWLETNFDCPVCGRVIVMQ